MNQATLALIQALISAFALISSILVLWMPPDRTRAFIGAAAFTFSAFALFGPIHALPHSLQEPWMLACITSFTISSIYLIGLLLRVRNRIVHGPTRE
jgi:hypothetical protein